MNFFKRGFGKNRRGETEWELWKIILVVVILAVVLFGIYLILVRKGLSEGGILDSIKRMLRLGR